MKTYRIAKIAFATLAALAIAGYVNTNQATPRVRTDRIDTGLVHMDMDMPATAALGSEILVDLQAGAVANAGNVVIVFVVPSGASYVRSEPAATVEGNKLTWKYGSLDRGQTTTTKVWLRADQTGAVVGEASVSAVPRMYSSTVVRM